MIRISLLFILLQCGSQWTNQLQEAKPKATYQKYVPGISGGVGINFQFEFEGSFPKVEIVSLVINDEDLSAEIGSRSPMVIRANRFYSQEQEGEENPSIPEAPLFTAGEYRAVLTFSVEGKTHSIEVTDFTEEETVIHP